MKTPDPYLAWLERENEALFYAAGVAWRLYFGRVLIPASLRPKPIELSRRAAQELLRESGADLIRWFSRRSEAATSYWYVLCDGYEFDNLSRKARNQIRKANSECAIRTIDAEWLAVNAYDCYAAAFGRYKHGHPITREHFERIQRSCIGGPFQFLGAFVGDALAGFAKCVISDDYVALVAFRLDPSYKKSMPSYALLDAMLRTYVGEQHKMMGNGFQSLHDDTNMQDFLLKFGFRRVYCDLRLAYKPVLAAAMRTLYPFRKLIDRLPSRPPITAVKSLLRQEYIRRQCVSNIAAWPYTRSEAAEPR